MRWRRSRTERRLRLEQRRLTLLRQLVAEQELRVDLARASLRQVILPAPGVHPHLVENNQQGPKPPPVLEASSLQPMPPPGSPLLLTDRELTPPPEPTEELEPMPPVQLELAQRLGLPPLPS